MLPLGMLRSIFFPFFLLHHLSLWNLL
jgi:hypothetical protein